MHTFNTVEEMRHRGGGGGGVWGVGKRVAWNVAWGVNSFKPKAAPAWWVVQPERSVFVSCYLMSLEAAW